VRVQMWDGGRGPRGWKGTFATKANRDSPVKRCKGGQQMVQELRLAGRSTGSSSGSSGASAPAGTSALQAGPGEAGGPVVPRGEGDGGRGVLSYSVFRFGRKNVGCYVRGRIGEKIEFYATFGKR